jgi:hypothetical protein
MIADDRFITGDRKTEGHLAELSPVVQFMDS